MRSDTPVADMADMADVADCAGADVANPGSAAITISKVNTIIVVTRAGMNSGDLTTETALRKAKLAGVFITVLRIFRAILCTVSGLWITTYGGG